MRKIQLTNSQKAYFKKNGFLIVEKVLEDGDLQDVIDELNAEIDIRAKKLVDQGELSKLYENESFETRLARISSETPKLAVSIWNGILHGPAIYKLITNSRLLDVAEAFCGSELIASSVYRLRPKIPNFGYGEVPWHQDSGYFEPYCDDSLILTMWIPLVDTSSKNGCLYVVPGSHKGKIAEHEMHESGKYLAIKEELVPADNRVECAVPKGGVLLLSNRVIHGSFKNSTDGVRWSMDLRYQSAELPTNASISTLKNETREDLKSGVPSACYPPDADFLVRSAKRQKEIIASYEEFNKLRETFMGKPVTNRFGVSWGEMRVEDV